MLFHPHFRQQRTRNGVLLCSEIFPNRFYPSEGSQMEPGTDTLERCIPKPRIPLVCYNGPLVCGREKPERYCTTSIAVSYPPLKRVGLSLARRQRRLRDNRRADSRPGNVYRRIGISRGRMTARHTTEMGLRGAICSFGVPTDTASLTGVGRIDDEYQHTCQCRLVADELAQLCECPIAVSRSLCLTQPCPFADSPQRGEDRWGA
jgi:hypothetical protein